MKRLTSIRVVQQLLLSIGLLTIIATLLQQKQHISSYICHAQAVKSS